MEITIVGATKIYSPSLTKRIINSIYLEYKQFYKKEKQATKKHEIAYKSILELKKKEIIIKIVKVK